LEVGENALLVDYNRHCAKISPSDTSRFREASDSEVENWFPRKLRQGERNDASERQQKGDIMITKKNLHRWLAIPVFAIALPTAAFAEAGDDNPTGVAGAFNGQITTGTSYDPYTGNMKREIDDIVVPGSIGAYPLKWSRYWNSHVSWRDNVIGAKWRFSYLDYWHSSGEGPKFPDGRRIQGDYGVEEWAETIQDPATYGISYPDVGEMVHLADGGKVILRGIYNGPTNAIYYHPIQIKDPYGQTTTLSWTQLVSTKFRLDKVTEPGGRYLQITWDSTNKYITRVEAFDGVNSQPIQWVAYTWTTLALNSTENPSVQVLSHVDYSDGASASYTYADGEYLGAPICTGPPLPRGHWHAPQLTTADDPRYPGPMRQIAYTYNADINNQTRIASEHHAIVANGQLTAGESVSATTGASDRGTTTASEARGDGATRTFNYHSVARCSDKDCPPPPDTEPCQPNPSALDGKLLNFTDFLGHTTTLTYETNDLAAAAGFITGVTDPNGHTTTYVRSNLSYAILRITHPDGTHIDQSFVDEAHPYFLASRTDERGNTTTYQRNPSTSAVNPNVIIRKDYPNDADEPASYETFTYNSLGEVLSHRMTNGATESFIYDSRGLKTSYTDATGAVTTYIYYTSGPWTDRLQTVTHPANASGSQASETYEYDRDSGGTAVAGRGLATKVTYADNSVPSGISTVTKTYNNYGDLLTSTDELGHTTTFTYDDYGRLLTATDPLNHTTTNSYVPTGQASSYVTTSKLPFSTTLPTGKQTTVEYDFNWRKTWIHQAPKTSDAANTHLVYDMYASTTYGNYSSIGNLLATIDPRNNVTTYHYDIRDRQDSITDPLGHTTSYTFDAHGNKTSETHANNELIEYLQYDAMNRLRHQRVHREAGIVDDSFSTYDAAGNLDTHTDEDGNVYNYDYDAMNRPTQLAYPNAKTEIHTYDFAGNVQTYTNRSGATQTFSYDNRNRQTNFTWTDGTSSQTTAYDAASRKTQIVNSDATINFLYYNDNKLHSQEEWVTATGVGDNVHRTVTYTYDPDGNRSSIQYPSGTKFDYDYTQRNQVADIKLDGQLTPIVSYGFDPAGNIMSRALDNGTSTAYTVDQANRDTAVVHALTGGPKRFDYVYNSVNDITAVQRDSDKGDAYEYDLTQEIKRFAQNGNVDLTSGTITSPANDTNMTFDGCGNQKSLNGGGTFVVNNLNEYTTYNGAAVGNDIAGNVQTYNGWTYTYDAQNRLRQAASATVTENFYYDGLNRQVARVTSGGTGVPNPTPSPLVSPIPTVSPLPTVPPTPTVPPIGITPTPTPTPKCSPPTITESNGQITMTANSPADATIFYTVQQDRPPGAPTHDGSVATGSTQAYSTPIPVAACLNKYFKAIEYHAGYTDSDVSSFSSNHGSDFGCGGLGPMSASSSSQTIIFSVWDGDWAILEEYDSTGTRVEAYVQGYHGLIKTVLSNIYYYQDELGSTSHIASSSGALIESYQYDVYGKPRVYNSSGAYQAGATPVAKDLFTGQRWHSELGLYDDRNRFMSPDLGRFLQPDPIGFKGDASNLYRYCGNDWANRADLMGLEGEATSIRGPDSTTKQVQSAKRNWEAPGAGLWKFEKQMEVGFELKPISGDQNIHVDRIKDSSGQVTKDLGRTDASLDIRPVSNGENAVKIVAETKINVQYADKVKQDAKDFARRKEPDHSNEIKQRFYDVAASRVKALNDHAKAFKSATEGLKTMESQLRQLFNEAKKDTIRAHDNYDKVHDHCDHCYQGDPFLP